MTASVKFITVIALLIVGFVSGQVYTNFQYKGWVELHATNTGTFILKDRQIFTVSELLSEEVHSASLIPKR